jgi:hypothetical protein
MEIVEEEILSDLETDFLYTISLLLVHTYSAPLC